MDAVRLHGWGVDPLTTEGLYRLRRHDILIFLCRMICLPPHFISLKLSLPSLHTHIFDLTRSCGPAHAGNGPTGGGSLPWFGGYPHGVRQSVPGRLQLVNSRGGLGMII